MRNFSPIIKQFRELKTKHPGAVILFRYGDFYESFEEDAETCARVLGIVVTKREGGFKMCGFPHHTLDYNLPRLIRSGHRVAICDQIEQPQKLTKRYSDMS